MTTHYECDVCGSTTTVAKDVHSSGAWHQVFNNVFNLGTDSHVCDECIERVKRAIEEEFE